MKKFIFRSLIWAAAAALFALAGIAWRLAPESPEECLQRGCVRAQAGKFEMAINDFNSVLRTNPQSAGALLLRGCCRAQTGNPEAAIQDFNECLLLNLSDASAWYDRGLAYLAIGERKKAAGDFGEAIRLNPGYTKASAALLLALAP